MKWSFDVFPKMGDITDGSQATQDQTADCTLLALPLKTWPVSIGFVNQAEELPGFQEIIVCGVKGMRANL